MLINRFNFIMWGAVPPEPAHLTQLPEGGPAGRVSSSVLLAPGESYSFYINAPDGIPTLGGTIDLVNDVSLTVVAGTVGHVTTVNAGLTNNQYIGTITVPAGLTESYYRLRILSTATSTLYYSNRLWYKPSGYADISVLASYRNSRDIIGAYFPYSLPDLASFRTVLRVKCYAGNVQSDDKIEDYKGVFTGVRRIVSHDQSQSYPFTCLNTDALGAEGFKAMLSHKDVLLNGKAVTLKTGFALATDSPHISIGTFEVWDVGFSLTTRC